MSQSNADRELLGEWKSIANKPEPAAKDRRDARAAVIAELLRLGHPPAKVIAAVKIADVGGSLSDAMEALK